MTPLLTKDGSFHLGGSGLLPVGQGRVWTHLVGVKLALPPGKMGFETGVSGGSLRQVNLQLSPLSPTAWKGFTVPELAQRTDQ